jgi:hypothetical protein
VQGRAVYDVLQSCGGAGCIRRCGEKVMRIDVYGLWRLLLYMGACEQLQLVLRLCASGDLS